MKKAIGNSYLDSSTPEYMDVAHHRLFGPPRIINECELKKSVNSRNLVNSFTSNLTTNELMLSTSTTSSAIKRLSSVFTYLFSSPLEEH
jgi:hypothetical protein